MEQAILKGKIVDAQLVASWDEPERAALRAQFKCIDCNAIAYFSKGSLKQAPYFAAKNHSDDCEEAYFGNKASDNKLNEAGTLVIPIDRSVSVQGAGFEDPPYQHVKPRAFDIEADSVSQTSATRGVRAVLRALINRPEFAKSAKRIVVRKSDVPASEFFVPFEQLEDQHVGRLIGVWGVIYSGVEGGSIAWLNRGDQKVSLEIPIPVLNTLKTIYKFENASELQGAHFLWIGTFNLHLQSRITDASQVAVRIVRR